MFDCQIKEPTLSELLSEPIVVMLMRRDGIDANAVATLLAGIQRRRGQAASAAIRH